jgi:hypothetical protein
MPEPMLVEGLLDGLLSDRLPEPHVPPAWPGTRPAVDEAAAGRAVAAGLADHRGHRRAWYGDLVGPLLVPALSAALLSPVLAKGDIGVPAVLLAPRDRTGDDLADAMRAARAQLLDDDRVELVGVELPFGAGEAAEAARTALDELDLTVPAWFRLPADAAWLPALDVVADDGVEHLSLELPPPAEGFEELAVTLHGLVTRGRAFAAGGTVAGPQLVTTADAHGLLNLLVAVDHVLGGAAPDQVAAVLASTDPERVIADAVRIEAVAAVRDRLARVTCTSVRTLVEDAETAGLIAPEVA